MKQVPAVYRTAYCTFVLLIVNLLTSLITKGYVLGKNNNFAICYHCSLVCLPLKNFNSLKQVSHGRLEQ